MTKLFLIAGCAALAACSQQQEPTAAENAVTNLAEANMETPAAIPAAFQLNETTWTFTDKDGQAIQESIDASGNYIANAGAKHVDHGTATMKGDKACFTSAMNNEGEECWSTKPVEIGQSMETTSDKGEKLTVTRIAYVPMTIPQ
jgi:hypothetical protein